MTAEQERDIALFEEAASKHHYFWRDIQIWLLANEFGQRAIEWSKNTDVWDKSGKRGYIAAYRDLLEGLMSLPDEPHETVRKAMREYIRTQCAWMRQVIEKAAEAEQQTTRRRKQA